MEVIGVGVRRCVALVTGGLRWAQDATKHSDPGPICAAHL